MYIDLPEFGMRMFAVINPPDYATPSPSTGGFPEPASGPLDPNLHTLVFIHSAFFSSGSWTPQFADKRLTGRYNLVAFDARFHGRTTAEDVESFTIRDSANSFITALDKLGISKYSLVGEGPHGATAVTLIAIQRPDNVESIVLVSPGRYITEILPSTNERKDGWIADACSNKNGLGDGTGRIPASSIEFLKEVLFGPDERNSALTELWERAVEGRYGKGRSDHDYSHTVTYMMGRHGQGISTVQRAALQLPILILAGSEDSLASKHGYAEEWREGFTGAKGGGATLQIVAGAPHLLMLTDGSVANRFLISFIDRHRPDETGGTRRTSLYM